eukprot:13532-Hanusia_phi.AAC.2
MSSGLGWGEILITNVAWLPDIHYEGLFFTTRIQALTMTVKLHVGPALTISVILTMDKQFNSKGQRPLKVRCKVLNFSIKFEMLTLHFKRTWKRRVLAGHIWEVGGGGGGSPSRGQ